MKKILVTGVTSYIGNSLKTWLSKYPDQYSVDFICLRNNEWRQESFTGYDVIFHTAAVVHVRENDKEKYFKVNRDLTKELAEKAKQEGVRQFIFLSTMGVYGMESGYITKESVPAPKTTYAQSKYEAEQLLNEICSNDFKIAILRPPIVYGKDCPGNYRRLSSLVLKFPLFPSINNQRSMIYIDNLSEFIRILIDSGVGGLYFPQNREYVNTTQLARLISKSHNRHINITKTLNWIVSLGLKYSETFRKVFGSFVYDKEMPGSPGTYLRDERINYEKVLFEDSINETERI